MKSYAYALALTALTAVPVVAQSPEGVPERTQAVSISPILALFEIVQGEYERKLGEETTAALGLGYWSFGDTSDAVDGSGGDEVSWLSLDLKGRFYPDEALHGFAIGGIVGATRIGYTDDATGQKESATGFAFGVDVSWAWLLGDTERWFLATGLGAKRYYFDEVDDDIPLILPTGRIAFGVAF